MGQYVSAESSQISLLTAHMSFVYQSAFFKSSNITLPGQRILSGSNAWCVSAQFVCTTQLLYVIISGRTARRLHIDASVIDVLLAYATAPLLPLHIHTLSLPSPVYSDAVTNFGKIEFLYTVPVWMAVGDIMIEEWLPFDLDTFRKILRQLQSLLESCRGMLLLMSVSYEL
jgi:hypothetical protein